jgi:hypothetical protein
MVACPRMRRRRHARHGDKREQQGEEYGDTLFEFHGFFLIFLLSKSVLAHFSSCLFWYFQGCTPKAHVVRNS